MGGGVGVAEAAGVGGGAHVHGLGGFFIHPAAQQGQQVIDDLGAAGAGGVHQLQVGEAGGAAVVIDAQPHPAQQKLKFLGQNAGGGHIHADDAVALLGGGDGEALMEPPEPGADPGIFQHMGGFAQAAQPQAQRRRGADGVPVGAGVGEDDIVVIGGKERRGFSSRQYLHGRSPEN